MIRDAYVFLHGMVEFRSDVTANYDCEDRQDVYDTGRDFAHRITFRIFEME